jgi:hypothetical protein
MWHQASRHSASRRWPPGCTASFPLHAATQSCLPPDPRHLSPLPLSFLSFIQDCGSAGFGGTKAAAAPAIAISPAVSLPREQYRRYLAELQLVQEAAAERERYKRMAAGDSPAAADAAAAAFLRGHRSELQQQALLAVFDEGQGGSAPDCGSKAGGAGRMHGFEPTTSTHASAPNRPNGGPAPSLNPPPDAAKVGRSPAALPCKESAALAVP